MEKLIQHVEEWARVRKLHNADPKAQALKVVEEFTELLIANREKESSDIIDGIGDTYVTLIILCKQLGKSFSEVFKMVEDEWGAYNVPEEALNFLTSGLAKQNEDNITLGIIYILTTLIHIEGENQYSPEQCLSVAYNEIKDRKGTLIDGTFVKYDDLSAEQKAVLDNA